MLLNSAAPLRELTAIKAPQIYVTYLDLFKIKWDNLPIHHCWKTIYGDIPNYGEVPKGVVRHNSSSILNNQNLGHLIKPLNGYREHEPAKPTEVLIETEKLRRHIKWKIIELFEAPLEHQKGLLGRHLRSCGLKSTSFSSKM